jgi:peroxiredoxin
MAARAAEIGKPAPDFSLNGLDGNIYRLSQFLGRIVVLNFWSAECPWAERVDLALQAWLPGYGSQVAWLTIAVNSNEPEETVLKTAEARNLPLLLFDIGLVAADLYQATTTPHLFVVNRDGILVYRGGYDDITFRQRNPTRSFIKESVDALKQGDLPEVDLFPPFGCTIVRFTP